MEKLIFNSSMPRAGSELLQVILHQNPRIYGSSTSPLLEYQFATRANFNLPEVASQNAELMEKAFLNMCAGMSKYYYGAITDRPVVCDKNRGWTHYYEWVNLWYKDPKMICMVRDLRDIVASMERVFQKNRHKPIGPDDPSKLQNMTVYQRAEYWLNSHPVGLSLLRTADLFERKVANKIHFVKYEDLISSPENTIKSIYGFIEEDSFQHDFNKLEKEVEERDSVFGPYGSHSVAPKIINKKSDWREILPKELGQEILRKYSWYYDKLKY